MADRTLSPEERALRRTWSSLWDSKKGEAGAWDSLSESVFLTLRSEIGELRGRRILEAGCGTGRISARIAEEGGRVTCLDIAPEALALAKRQFKEGDGTRFVLSSILEVPRENEYDVIWNSGVMEHLVAGDQQRAIGEFLSILRPGGKVVLLTPYSRSLLYRMGKWMLEKTHRWPFGREVPVRSLGPVTPASGALVREYSVSFLPLVFDSHKWIPAARPFLKAMYAALVKLLGPRVLFKIDLLCSRAFGGYLLVSVIARR